MYKILFSVLLNEGNEEENNVDNNNVDNNDDDNTWDDDNSSHSYGNSTSSRRGRKRKIGSSSNSGSKRYKRGGTRYKNILFLIYIM